MGAALLPAPMVAAPLLVHLVTAVADLVALADPIVVVCIAAVLTEVAHMVVEVVTSGGVDNLNGHVESTFIVRGS